MKPCLTGKESAFIRTPAKLNLLLEVTGKRPDGFHELDMIMEAVDLCDVLEATKTGKGIELRVDTPEVPADRSNLVVRAAERYFAASGLKPGVRFELRKQIPVGGGLGGGSGNAAGTLYLLGELFGRQLSAEALYEIACGLGSDIPFFLRGGLCRCRGRGEVVEPLGSGSPRRYVILVPPFRVSTEKAYATLTFPLTAVRKLGNIGFGHVERSLEVGELCFNRLQASAVQLRPELQRIIEKAGKAGVRVQVTGSGSCLFGLLPVSDKGVGGGSELAVLEDKVRIIEVWNLPAWG